MGILVFFGALKEQVVLDHELRHSISMLFPQGWSFFTKSPRDESLMVYRIVDGKTEAIPVNNHDNRGFGLSRTTRLIGYEASMIINEVPPASWKTFKNKPISAFVNDSAVVVKQQEGFHHLLEGEYIFKLFKVIPFAWAGQQQAENNPFRITRISIR